MNVQLEWCVYEVALKYTQYNKNESCSSKYSVWEVEMVDDQMTIC